MGAQQILVGHVTFRFLGGDARDFSRRKSQRTLFPAVSRPHDQFVIEDRGRRRAGMLHPKEADRETQMRLEIDCISILGINERKRDS